MAHFFSTFRFSNLVAAFFVLGGLWLAAAPAGAQLTLVSLYSFTAPDGLHTEAGLVQGSDGNFYGTAPSGGAFGYGTIFRVSPSGTLTTLVSFDATNGAVPEASLILGSDGNFYGTTSAGGSSSDGTVFKVTPSGVLTTLAAFTDVNGSVPLGSLVQGNDGSFYGAASQGGMYGYGTVFKVTAAGAVTTLVNFGNANGAQPVDGLVLGSDGNFYGTTFYGGTTNTGDGTVFKVTPSGTLTTLISFSGSNGGYPNANLIQANDGNFYGTTFEGGSFGFGTVFKITPAGTLTTLVNFGGSTGTTLGENPLAGLILGSDGNFYGTTFDGGATEDGTVFKVTPAGTVTLLATFGANGIQPRALMQGTDGNFYGTTGGGSSGYGTVFKMSSSGTVTTLVHFSTTGANPYAALVQGSDGTFYGTTEAGGSYGYGTVFKVTASGALTTLHSFSVLSGGTNGDGAFPYAALVQGSDGNFYGTTNDGGSSGYGTVFKITPTGTLTTLYSFSNDSSSINRDGANPVSGLAEGSDGNFYGTTNNGGSSGYGTVFKITPTGTLTTLVNFNSTNGANPQASLIQGRDGNFYGTTYGGGSYGYGTVFKVTSTGTLTTLANFTGANGTNPKAGLVQGNDGNFYGTTNNGGSSGYGTVFKITPTGTLTTLVNFNSTNGANPQASLIQGRDGNFYGTTYGGGSYGYGTVFNVTASGALTTLYIFSSPDESGSSVDGANPYSSLVQGSDGNFYGTTEYGGSGDIGTIYGLFGPPSAFGASETTNENTPVDFAVAFDDPSGKGVSSIAFPTPPAHGKLTVGAITEPGTTGTVALTYTPTANYVGADSFTYTVTSSVVGTSAPQTVTLNTNRAPQTITSFSPTSGPIGTVVTITGTSFSDVTAMRFHEVRATVFAANAAGTQLTVTVPEGAATGTITVTTAGGSVKTAVPFTIIPPPTITSFTPASGPIGAIITITGTNFGGTTRVRFHNASAVTYSVNAQGTQITVIVPTGAGTGTITVDTPGGGVTSAATFTVLPPPTITSFTPTSGPIGTVVTITGTHLNGVTRVRFHNASAVTYSVNAQGTQITVTVPTGAGTGTITVDTPGGGVTSAATFTVNRS